MIKGYKNRKTERVAEGARLGFKGLDYQKAQNRLDYLETIETLTDIPDLNTWKLHQLKGSRKGQWAISVNARWRIVFDWTEGGPDNVEIIDYHKG